MVRHQHADRRLLVGHPIAADPGLERTVLRVVELELVVLHDHRSASVDILQQPVVVGPEIGSALVGTYTRNDHIET